MKKIKFKHFLTAFAFLLLSIGFALTTWKMFQFRGKLNGIMDNDCWQQTLSENQVYNNNLIVFFGDSEIDMWPIAPSFGTLSIINKGISNDMASKAIKRFDKDVIDLKPKVLVMLIGTNDLGNGQPVDAIINSIENMIKKTENMNMKVILCSLLPVRNEYISNHPLNDIIQINKKIELLSKQYNADYVDFYSQLADNEGQFRLEYTIDGLHPSLSGYLRMSKTIMPYLIKHIVDL